MPNRAGIGGWWLVAASLFVTVLVSSGLLYAQKHYIRVRTAERTEAALRIAAEHFRSELDGIRAVLVGPAAMPAIGLEPSPRRFPNLARRVIARESTVVAMGWARREEGLDRIKLVVGQSAVRVGDPLDAMAGGKEIGECVPRLLPVRVGPERRLLLLEPAMTEQGCAGHVFALLALRELEEAAGRVVGVEAYIHSAPVRHAGRVRWLFPYLGQTWQIDAERLPVVLPSVLKAGPWVVLGMGLGFTVLLGAYLRQRATAEQQLRAEIAERQRQLALREALLAHAPDGVVVLDGDGRIREVNHALCRMLGWAQEELVGREIEVLVPEAKRDEHRVQRAAFLSHATDGAHLMAQGRVLHARAKDGSEVDVEVGLARVQLDGRALAVAFVRDVRERRRAEGRSRVLASIIEASSDFVSIADGTGRVVYLNRAGRGMVGLPEEGPLGELDASKLVPDWAMDKILHEGLPAARTDGCWHGETALLAADGREIPVSQLLIFLPSAGDGVRYTATICRDISETKRLLERLRQSKGHLAEAQRLAGIGSWELDFGTGRLHWSHEVFQIFETEPERFAASYEAFLQLVHPEDREAVDKAYRRSVRERTPYRITHRVLLPDGRVKHVEERGKTLYRDDGSPQRSIGTVQDITDRVDAERLLEEKLAAEAASHAKSAFLAMMSHEIRTPLHGILGTLELLHRTQLDARQREMVERARLSSQNLLGVISDVLDFSKIEAGALDLSHDPFPLRRALEECAVSLGQLALVRGVRLVLDVPSEPDDVVLGDGPRLRQICSNLLSNGIKFTAGRPGATVWMRMQVRSRTERDIAVRIVVEDNGIGMLEEQQRRIFRPFAQADSDTTRRFGGTGLGLAIVSELVAQMNGEIHLESEPGRGSRFAVELTFPRAAGYQPVALPDLSGVQVVAWADDVEVGEICARHLSAIGAEVERAADLDALARRSSAAEGAPDLVLIYQSTDAPRGAAFFDRLRGFKAPVLVVAGWQSVEVALPPGIGLLHYPCRLEALLAQAAILCGRLEEEAAISSLSLELPAPPLDEAEAEAAGRLILVAEDNEINRQVIREQLVQLGYRAVIAADGRDALKRFGKRRFAAVLSDAHMPNLDGFGLTRAIRAREAEAGQRIPILILTADATPQEAERCRGAGADDILTKPLALSELRLALERWLGAAAQKAPAEPTSPREPQPEAVVWDPETLGRVVGDDAAFQRRLLERFLADAPAEVEAIRRAAEAADAAAAAAGAHKLKSSARTVGALRLAQVCDQLERTTQTGGNLELADLARALVAAFEALRERIGSEA